jgi:hypothetical protein
MPYRSVELIHVGRTVELPRISIVAEPVVPQRDVIGTFSPVLDRRRVYLCTRISASSDAHYSSHRTCRRTLEQLHSLRLQLGRR